MPVWTTPPGAVSRVPPASLPDHLAQAGLQIGGLAVRGAPAALAGLQDKEELAIGVGLLQPALLLKEGVGVRNAVGQGYDGDVGAEGGVLAHIELEGAAGGLAVLEGVGVIADDGVLIDFSAVDGQERVSPLLLVWESRYRLRSVGAAEPRRRPQTGPGPGPLPEAGTKLVCA